MTSPLDLSVRPVPSVPLRVGFFGRVSDKDLQDPSLSIPRQFRRAGELVTGQGWVITKSCWDIESGRKVLSERGRGADGTLFGVETPRDGGLPELLDFARDHEIDVVVVESIDRLARITRESTNIEYEFERFDVPVLACDEPLERNATAMFTRRMKQAQAEYYVAELLEKSRKGMMESVYQGWHTGGPIPYGYLGETNPHPNPIKARDGKTKTKLVVDPIRGPVVKRMYVWYCVDCLGLGEIVDRLNANPEKCPPPSRSGHWTKATVQTILRNPKYTGFNVWNRHDKRRGRPTLRPRSGWVWSEQPTHEPIVSMELYETVELRAQANAGGTGESRLQENAPSSRFRGNYFYPTRGHSICNLCGHRMEGSHQKGSNYMRCLWASGKNKMEERATGHPGSLQIKEEILIQESLTFLSESVFSAEAIERFRHEIEAFVDPETEVRVAMINRLRKELDTVETAIGRQTRAFERYSDPDDQEDPVGSAIAKRIQELQRQRTELSARFAVAEEEAQPSKPTAELAEILENLPDLRPALASYSDEELAELFDAFDLEMRYDHLEKTLKLSATVFPELSDVLKENDRPRDWAGRRKSYIAGAGFEPATSGL